ncbi:MAG: hypothetical protein QOJ85_1573 [Solirubrobacteraceae bacterium]|jgi:hypothetical protein|nr:hypothetical protein [Solirubrobacteraceae bacterium]
MQDFLDVTRGEIRARLTELEPLVDEYRRLEAAATALDRVPSAGAARRGAPGRAASNGRRPGSATGARRGRPKGSGTRSKEVLQLVAANPGITVTQLAERIGIKQNYLYRLLPQLARDGLVTKDGRGWHPSQAA